MFYRCILLVLCFVFQIVFLAEGPVPGSWPAPVARAGMAPAGCFPVPCRLWKMAAGRQSSDLLGSSPQGPAGSEDRLYAMESCKENKILEPTCQMAEWPHARVCQSATVLCVCVYV